MPITAFQKLVIVSIQMFNNLLLNKRGGPFSWKYFAMSHDKGVIDGTGGKAKALSKSYEYSR